MRKAILSLMLCLFVVVSGFSNPIKIDELEKTMETFSKELALSLPFNSSMGLNWADANIGKFPHFGMGLSLGFTTMEAGSFAQLLDYFAPAIPGWVMDFGGFPIPGYAAEARMGGFILPFDIGFKIGVLPIQPKGGAINLKRLEYVLIGGDVRLQVLEENALLPCISVGVGYNYMKGGMGMSAGEETKMNYDPLDPAKLIVLSAPELDLDWDTHSLDFKAQISKSLLIITPYIGFGASNGWSKAGYRVGTTIEKDGGGTMTPAERDEIMNAMKEFGLGDIKLDTGFGSSSVFSGWSFRLFGGFSINAPLVRFEFTGLYNFRDKKYGVSVGAHLQV